MKHHRIDPIGARRATASPDRRTLLAGLGAGTALALTGCADLNILPGQRQDPDFYRLTPKSTFDPGLPTVTWQLVVETPVANAGLSQLRIALMQNPVQIEYYARANWTDRVPQMLQTLMLESFDNSGHIVSVGRELIGLRADFLLKTEVREFQAEYFHENPLPHAHVAFASRLVAMPRREIVGNQGFRALVPATADRMDEIINAFDVALGQVLKELVGWTLKTGQKVYSERQTGA